MASVDPNATPGESIGPQNPAKPDGGSSMPRESLSTETRAMSAKALEALRGSIAKWEKILTGTDEDIGYLNCPLCAAFYEDDNCAGCPVKERTGRRYCMGSPYDRWHTLMVDTHGNAKTARWTVTDDASRELAQAELDFLKSLLPPGVES